MKKNRSLSLITPGQMLLLLPLISCVKYSVLCAPHRYFIRSAALPVPVCVCPPGVAILVGIFFLLHTVLLFGPGGNSEIPDLEWGLD